MREEYQHQYFKDDNYSKIKTKDYIAQVIEIKKDPESLGGKDRPYEILTSTHFSNPRHESGAGIRVSKEGLLILRKLLNRFIRKSVIKKRR